MKIIKNYLYNALYQLFKVLIPFITIPYLSRVLGPKGIGINSYTNSIIQYFILLGDLGITVYGNRKIAYVRDNKYKLTQTFWEIMIMQVCTVTVAYCAFLMFLMFTTYKYRPYYFAQSIMIIAGAFDISWFFMGIENFKVTVLKNFIVRILALLLIFLFVKSYSDLYIYIFLYSLSFLVGNVTLFVNLGKYVKLPNISKLHIWKHLKPSFILLLPTLATQVYLMLNKTMLGIIKNVQSSGFYDQSDKVVKIVLSIVTATGTVMLPHVANAFANGNKKKTKKYLYNSFSFVTCLSISMAFGLSAIAPKFVPMFFGHKFSSISIFIMLESIVIIIIAWSNVVGIQYLLPTNQTRSFILSVTLGAIVNVILNIPMIILFNVIGSIISTIISEMTVTIYQMWSIHKQVDLNKLFKGVYKYLLAGIIMFILVLLMNLNLEGSWPILLLEILVGIIIYLVLITIFHTNIFQLLKNISMK